MEVDQARWAALLNAYEDARDQSPSSEVRENARTRLQQARVALGQHHARYQAHGLRGRSTERHQPDDIARLHERDMVELERQLANTQREVDRVQALAQAASVKRRIVGGLIEDCRKWAADQHVALPGSDASTAPTRSFGSLLVHEPAPAGGPQQQGGGGPTAHHQGGMLQRVWP